VKRVFYALVFCAALLLISTTVFAVETNNNADSIEYYTFAEIFPDANFREYVTDTVLADSTDSKANDAALTAEQLDRISTYSWVNVSSREIKSLDGIELFTGLIWLDCWDNQLTTLDVSKNPLLEQLECINNQLTTLDISNNPLLRSLNCGNNQLTALDVSSNLLLRNLDCGNSDNDGWSNNQITSLDVSNNPALEFLNCGGNELTALDVSNNPLLESLYCSSNQLTTLDVNSNLLLKDLWCSSNQLTALDVSNHPALRRLNCDGVYVADKDGNMVNTSQLSTLNASNNPSLEFLWCSDNRLTTLNVSNAPALTELHCQGNKLTALDISTSPALTELWCYNNYLSTVNVRNNPMLTTLHCGNNPLTKLDVSSNTALTYLDCSGGREYIEENNVSVISQLTTLNVSNNLALEYLDCYNNQLTVLDVRNNSALKSLDCGKNQLKTLDVSNNTKLWRLWCCDNQLTELDVSRNTLLSDFKCQSNHLTSLDLSHQSALEYLWCDYNQLTELDVSTNTLLKSLGCQSNHLTSLDLSHQTALEYLWCDYNRFLLTSNAAQLDLNTLPGAFDVTKASEWTCAHITNGTTLEIPSCATSITYKYDMGNGFSEIFTLERDPAGTVPHSFGEWVTTIPATATTDGEEQHSCSVCGYKETLTIPATGNNGGGNSGGGGGSSSPAVKPADATPEPELPVLRFTDVSSSAYYYNAVAWAVDGGITSGISANTFSPDNACSRAQVITFLWRMAESPVVTSTVTAFDDVPADSYYWNAVQWATANGITAGIASGLFGSNSTCTRGQMAALLYRYAGSPAIDGELPFADVSADSYYAKAVIWAVENGITNGVSETAFAPDNICTRAQIVAFLYRAFANR